MSILSKFLAAVNLDRKPKAQPATPSPDAIKKVILDEIPVFTKQVDSPVVTNEVKADIIKNVEQGMERQLRTRKFGIHFELTPEMRAIVQPEIVKNVSLIKDIPSQYFTEVEELVMQSVAAGGDLYTLSIELSKRYGITPTRAGEIATDQNKKINAVMKKVGQLECGITLAEWRWTRGGCVEDHFWDELRHVWRRRSREVNAKHPTAAEVRKSEAHKAFSGKTYELAKGAFIDGEYIWPGQKAGCKCMSFSIMPWDMMKRDASPAVVASVHTHHRERLAAQQMLLGLIAHWEGWRTMQGDDVPMQQRQFVIQYDIDALSAQGLNKADSIALSAKIMATLREANVEFTLDANG